MQWVEAGNAGIVGPHKHFQVELDLFLGTVLDPIPVNEFHSSLFVRHLRVTRLCSLVDLFQVSGVGCQKKTCCHSIDST